MWTLDGPVCDSPFPASGRRRYCSDACRQAAWRHHQATPPTSANPNPKPAIVYECPTCDARYLGEQRCPDCNTFCRRLGFREPIASNRRRRS